MNTSLRGTILRVVISFGAIGVIVYMMRDKIGETWEILRSDVLWQWFYLALGCYIIANLVVAVRLMCVFKTQNIHLSYGQSLYLCLLGLFFNLFLPSAIGGDVAKLYFAYKYTGKKIESASSILQDRIVGFIVIMIMAFLALTILSKEFSDPRISRLVFIFIGIMVFLVFFIFSKRFAIKFKFLQVLLPSDKVRSRLSELYHALYNFKQHTFLLIATLGLSLVAQFFFIMIYYFLSRSLGIEMSMWLFFLFIPVVAIVSMMPSLGGLGVREAGLIFFLKRYMLAEEAMVVSLLAIMVTYGVAFLCGVIYAFRGELKDESISKISSIEGDL